MPIPGARYRMKNGVRLAFKAGQVVEAKNMKTGATHTPEEFKKDREGVVGSVKRVLSGKKR